MLQSNMIIIILLKILQIEKNDEKIFIPSITGWSDSWIPLIF